MARTHKHRLARQLHKAMRATHWSAWGDIKAALPASAGATRYGNKRHYEAAMKVKQRRSLRGRLRQQDRHHIADQIGQPAPVQACPDGLR